MKSAMSKAFTAALIVVFLASCAQSVTYFSPEEYGRFAGKTVLVEKTNGVTVKLMNVFIDGRQIVGATKEQDRVRIDLANVKSVRIEKKLGRGLPYVYAGAGLVLAWLIIGAETAPPPPDESCPYIYSFDGDALHLDAEPYGAALCEGLKRSEWVAMEHLKPVRGEYRVHLANELRETEYTDELRLLVVDHPAGLTVFPDAEGGLHAISAPQSASSARDSRGADISGMLAGRDLVVWQTDLDRVDPQVPESLRDELTLVFPKPAGARTAKLLVNAATTVWGTEMGKRFLGLHGENLQNYYTDVNRHGPSYTQTMAWHVREEMYLMQVRVLTAGGWRTRGTIYGGGPMAPADKAYVIDVADVPGETLTIRLTPPANFWTIDRIAVDYSADAPLSVIELEPSIKGRADGADIAARLRATDASYLVMPEGRDPIELAFGVPPASPEKARTLVLKASGYYDVGLDTAGVRPRPDILARFAMEPGSTIRFAMEEYLEWKAEQDANQRARRTRGN